MSLADNYRILEYVSDGKQVEFPVLWRFFDPDTVLVKIYSKDGILVNHLSYGRDYSVVATGEDTGRVTLMAPVASGLIVVIYRLEPYVQLLELLNSGKFDLVKLEECLDHIVMLTQQNRDELLRCLQVPPGSEMTPEEFVIDLLKKYGEILDAWQKISIALQNLFSQTIVPFTTRDGVLEYEVGEDVILDPDANNLLLSLDGVVQEPDRAYTIVDKNHIRFTTNPGAGLRCWGISCLSFANPDIRSIVQKALEKIWAEANKIIATDAFVVPGTTEARNLLERFGDFINVKDFGAKGDGTTDDTKAINAALSFAAAKKSLLFFPAGTYSAPQGLVGFRSVRKIGSGVIKRGAYTYSITPTTVDTNVFYVSPTGGVYNDGLTPDTPITISTAFSSMRYLAGAAETGQWKIKFLPGTYRDNGVRITYLPSFSKPLTLEGEREILSISTEAEYSDDFLYYTDSQCTSVPYVYDPDTWLEAKRAGLWRQRPTVTWDGTDSTEHYALRMSQPNVIPLTLFIQDITFANWKHVGFEGNSGGAAIDCCVTYSLRCRFYNCGVGEWYRSGQSTHKQNVYRDCGIGTRGQYSHSGTIGDIGGGACLFSGCDIGMHVGRASVMHNDGNHYTTCGYSCETAYLSRNAIVGGVYRDWKTACFVQYNNSIVTNPESAKYIGSLSGNTPLALSRFGSIVESGGDGIAPSIAGYSFPNQISMIHTGTTARTLLTDSNYGRIATIPKRSCLVKGTPDSGMIIRVFLNASLSGSGSCTLQLANTPAEAQIFSEAKFNQFSGWIIFEVIVGGPNASTGVCTAKGRSLIQGTNTMMKTDIGSSAWKSAMVGESLDANLLRFYATLTNASDTLTIGGWYTELYRG